MTASLRQADLAKTAFISDVSHELRTPLTVIKGTIETLQDGALDDLTGRGRLLNSMDRETERLIKLVNDLLVLTRADAGALNLQLSQVDLGELARARSEHFARTAGMHQVSVLTLTDPQPDGQDAFSVLADPDRIAQVLDNLLDNAIRYSSRRRGDRDPRPASGPGGMPGRRCGSRHPRPTPALYIRALLPGEPGAGAWRRGQRSGVIHRARPGAGPRRAHSSQQPGRPRRNPDLLAPAAQANP
jgi:hypothetical protein